MKTFRLKLTAILLSSVLNIRRGRPLFPINDNGPGSLNDVVEIENPKKKTPERSNCNLRTPNTNDAFADDALLNFG